jgi:hypothetical protein
MPVHFFNPPASYDSVRVELPQFVAEIEANGEEVVGTEPYGQLTAVFTRVLTPARPPARKQVTR